MFTNMNEYSKVKDIIETLRASDDYSDPLDEEIADTLEELLEEKISDVDSIVHYRNLSIDLGAQPEDMINHYDRWLCANWARMNHDDGWHREDVQDAWEEAEEALIKYDLLRDEMKILQEKISSLAIVDRVNNELIAAQSARIEHLETIVEELSHVQQVFKEEPINANPHT